MYSRIKRWIDLIFASILTILLLPILIVTSLVIKSTSRQPIFFKQLRIGQNNKEFTIYKFRTMVDKYDKNGQLLPDDDRLTKIGSIIRKLSIDELPQLINVIKGDMSFIGPRPLVKQYLPYYSEQEIKRHNVKPGISGLAQINGRNSLTWEEKFAYDLEYVSKMSLHMDIRIACMTIIIVVKKKDIVDRGIGANLDFDVYRKNGCNL